MVEEHLQKFKSGLKICDVIDYVYGSSLGGLIALQLSSGYSAHQILKFFTDYDILQTLFGDFSYQKSIHEQFLESRSCVNFIGDLFRAPADEREGRLKNVIMDHIDVYSNILNDSHKKICDLNVGVLTTA